MRQPCLAAALAAVLLVTGCAITPEDARRGRYADLGKFYPLHEAALENDAPRIEELVRNGWNVNAKLWPDEITPLWYAVYKDNEFAANALLEAGADPRLRKIEYVVLPDKALNTYVEPIHTAASSGRRSRILVLLIKHGADVNARDPWGMTPLHYAAREANFEGVKILLDHGADPNIQSGILGVNVISEAVMSKGPVVGIKKVVDLLVARGVRIDVGTSGGWTPLESARQYGQAEIYRYLIDRYGLKKRLMDER